VTEQHRKEQQTEQAIKVCQVTEVHGNFNELERGEPGKFSLQFVLDDGAEEYVLRPTAEDARTLMLMRYHSSRRRATLDPSEF
jgi:hypothetical protein